MLKGVFREKNKRAEGFSEGTGEAQLAEAEGLSEGRVGSKIGEASSFFPRWLQQDLSFRRLFLQCDSDTAPSEIQGLWSFPSQPGRLVIMAEMRLSDFGG